MTTWLVALLKGGVRKSTTAMMLAFALSRTDHEVLVVDADSGTQGVTDWATRVYARGEELPFHVVQWSHRYGLLAPFIKNKARELNPDFVVIDIGGEAPEVLGQAAILADLVISPTGPEQAELSRVEATAVVIRAERVPQAVLLTRVPQAHTGVALSARQALTEGGYRVLETEIPQHRGTYAHIWGTIPGDLGAYAQLAGELLDGQS